MSWYCGKEVGPGMACPRYAGHQGPCFRPDSPNILEMLKEEMDWQTPCQHQWMFLTHQCRSIHDHTSDPVKFYRDEVDIFYCQKCLEKKEVPA